jgi:glyoxylate/hydroxypyruvate reductase
MDLYRAVILPHIGSATTQTRVEMAKRAVRNAISGLLGEEMEAEVLPAKA